MYAYQQSALGKTVSSEKTDSVKLLNKSKQISRFKKIQWQIKGSNYNEGLPDFSFLPSPEEV
jgi:hypothetical protein